MQRKLLTENNCHSFICGITRSGKTYFAIRAAAELKRPVLFFNIQDEETPAPFLTIDYTIEKAELLHMLRQGYKLDFTFGDLPEDKIMSIIAFLLKALMRSGFTEEKPVYIILDEAQILKDSALEAAISVSTRGLKKGCRLITVTQRPALVNKTIYTQAAEQYIFFLALSEKGYLKNKGIDYDYCLKEWEKLGKHSYIFSDGYNLIGYKKIT